MKKLIIIGLLLATTVAHAAGEWHTLFAYNNVTQITMSDNEVYALSDGSLFSVNKNTEMVSIYENLHSSGISCIYYDDHTEQLIIAYTNGKLDLLSSRGVQYIGDLYDKDMLQQKNIYNITINGYTAYFSTHYGIQTFNLHTNTLVDSYWIGDHGQEMKIEDVLIANDSIYAFTTDSLFCAAMSDNLNDYRDWRREARTGRISPDTEKGKHYQDATDHWYAGGAEGIVRFTPTEHLSYKPLGPLNNTPYRLTTAGSRLYMVSGGRWSTQFTRPGDVMIYEDGSWTNISREEIAAKLNKLQKNVTDFMNVAVDPQDNEHFFVTSYGTGLYEFQGTEVIRNYIASDDNPIESAVASNPDQYTRLLGAHYDQSGNLWFVNAHTVPYQFIALDNQGEWHGIPLIINGQHETFETPADMIIDHRNPHYKWLGAARGACLCLLDDNGTPFDASDDHATKRNEWTTPSGRSLKINEIREMIQDRDGRIWLGTDQGIVIIDTVDFFTSDRCLRPELMDENGENPLESLKVMALCQDTSGRIWVGTETMGVYVLNAEATEILAHYTSDNTPMLSENILSISCDTRDYVYVGTAEGLVSYREHGETHDTKNNGQEDQTFEYGTMQQWRLHYSYSDPQELTASASHIYANASGALLSVDRGNEEIKYWSKADGMSGSSIAHIHFDSSSKCLVIAYEDGRIDLLSDNGDFLPLPDLYMKASSVATQVNAISSGKRAVYLAMPFGIIAINPQKGEVIDTYYIGANASAVDVKHVVEIGDSIYAFSDTHVYKAALSNNLVDYAFWHAESLPFSGMTHADCFHDRLYALAQGTLYMLRNGTWQPAVSQSFEWIHVANNRMLGYITGNGLYGINDNGEIDGLTSKYVAIDAIYSQGEYWLTEDSGTKLVRLSSDGDDHFTTHCPNSNFAYTLHTAHNKLYSAIGGRWADSFGRYAKLNIYDGKDWENMSWRDIMASSVGKLIIDPVSIAVDPSDAGHYFVATYGTSVLEFRNSKPFKQHNATNSTLRPWDTTVNPNYFTRTDGAMMDAAGNLWVLNATQIGQPLHVLTPNGQWHGIPLRSGGQSITFTTPTCIHSDYRNANRKWMIEQRADAGVILLDDGGTPTITSDDKCIKRTSWIDQNGKITKPEYVLCLTQDLHNRIWIGTQAGIIIIPASVDYFSSNTCHRVIIPRNDGTKLGDYLLGDERINCMAVDGGNRMWIGTENSGLYLIEDDTITVAHFTENNSLLPSNTIQSIAIQPTTGEVFVGTSKGLASYRADASEASEDLSKAYAFPNPVRPNYGGIISIAGLMENTVVNIVDAGGSLVCKTKSHGGLAVWDGRLQDGRRATAGIYTALCNSANGHTVVKILVIR